MIAQTLVDVSHQPAGARDPGAGPRSAGLGPPRRARDQGGDRAHPDHAGDDQGHERDVSRSPTPVPLRREPEGRGYPPAVPIEVVAYDARWPALADAARDELVTALPGVFVEIEHIGSTSVPGLAAKPIIDLMAAAGSLSGVTEQDPTLRTLGYERHETGMPGRLFYRRDRDGRRTHQLHVVTMDSWPTRNERILRDYLRTHADDAARYGALKQALSSQHSVSLAYTRAKTELIQELTDRARAERGLPPVPVWE